MTPPRKPKPSSGKRMELCAGCGSHVPAGSYHPFAFCVLARALNAKAAQVSINEVLDHGRQLERLGLPNDASNAAVVDAKRNARKALTPSPRSKRNKR